MWCSPPKQDATFVCAVKQVLAVYTRMYDPDYPVVCTGETSVQCVKEVRPVVPGKPGQVERYDIEYERIGVAHLIQLYAPCIGCHRMDVADTHAALQGVQGVWALAKQDCADAEKMTLVMDTLNTHSGASLYQACPPETARALLKKLELAYTPKHGSWLNMAECEFSVLSLQCLARRTQRTKPVDWRSTREARIKLTRLYPDLSE